MDVIQVHHECHIREPKANWTKHLPHEPSETICRKTQEMEINTLGKCIDRYQFCLQESSWTSGEFKKNVTVDFRSLGCDRRQRYLNHACHASTFENGIFINAHIALVYLGLCWLTFNCFFFFVHFWIPGKYGLLLRHSHLISDIWIVTEWFLYEQI